MTRKRFAEFAADVGVVADEIARLDQQIEKIERAGFLLALFVALQAVAHLLVQQRREIGVGLIAKRAQRLQQIGVRGKRLIARDADRECRAGAFLRIREVAVLARARRARLPIRPTCRPGPCRRPCAAGARGPGSSCRAGATDTENLSSRLIGFAVSSANALSCAISDRIEPWRS